MKKGTQSATVVHYLQVSKTILYLFLGKLQSVASLSLGGCVGGGRWVGVG